MSRLCLSANSFAFSSRVVLFIFYFFCALTPELCQLTVISSYSLTTSPWPHISALSVFYIRTIASLIFLMNVKYLVTISTCNVFLVRIHYPKFVSHSFFFLVTTLSIYRYRYRFLFLIFHYLNVVKFHEPIIWMRSYNCGVGARIWLLIYHTSIHELFGSLVFPSCRDCQL